jgi:hypothetical protein
MLDVEVEHTSGNSPNNPLCVKLLPSWRAVLLSLPKASGQTLRPALVCLYGPFQQSAVDNAGQPPVFHLVLVYGLRWIFSRSAIFDALNISIVHPAVDPNGSGLLGYTE